MRGIKVTYRAVFQQPIGILNPLGVRLSMPCAVEIFSTGKTWQAREIDSPKRNVYEKLNKYGSDDAAKRIVESVFEKRLQDWQMWGIRPDDCGVEIQLTPYEVADLGDGKFGWIQDEDRTHILHGPLIRPEARVPNAACGASVNAKCFISTKANVEPTCRGCAEVWKREYRGK